MLAYLLSNKLQVPDKIFLLRGNHETRSVNGWVEYYGDGSFLAQCNNRFGEAKGTIVWEVRSPAVTAAAAAARTALTARTAHCTGVQPRL